MSAQHTDYLVAWASWANGEAKAKVRVRARRVWVGSSVGMWSHHLAMRMGRLRSVSGGIPGSRGVVSPGHEGGRMKGAGVCRELPHGHGWQGVQVGEAGE